jgi:hypothetical protein
MNAAYATRRRGQSPVGGDLHERPAAETSALA